MYKSLTDCFTLSNGIKIPCVGFGTWQAEDGDTAKQAVVDAIASGYRHIDTAAVYGNEASVGAGIKESGVKREDLFVTTKLWNSVRGYEETKEAFAKSMEKLQLDYLDLYMIHWPNPAAFRDRWQQANAQSWRAMEDLYAEGKIRALGVSNFRPHHLDALYETAKVMPVVNQIRLCPGELNPATVTYCLDHDILLQAYSPLGTGKVFKLDTLQEMAKKYHKSIAQICLRWNLQHGFLPLPKSVHADRIRENADIFDFELESKDMEYIDSLKEVIGLAHDPDYTSF